MSNQVQFWVRRRNGEWDQVGKSDFRELRKQSGFSSDLEHMPGSRANFTGKFASGRVVDPGTMHKEYSYDRAFLGRVEFIDALPEKLLALAREMSAVSEGRLRLASEGVRQPAIAHFLAQCDSARKEKKIGRAIEEYAELGHALKGWDFALMYFADEIVIPLKGHCNASYVLASEALRSIGKIVIRTENRPQWDTLFA